MRVPGLRRLAAGSGAPALRLAEVRLQGLDHTAAPERDHEQSPVGVGDGEVRGAFGDERRQPLAEVGVSVKVEELRRIDVRDIISTSPLHPARRRE
jgi:hypothetical protein